jgi:hypothetical protein
MNISPLVRNLLILAGVALVIVVLNLEQSLVTASVLLRVAFFLVLGVVAYFLWRDLGRREIGTWPSRQQYVFYAAVGLFVIDLGWYFIRGVTGRDALAFFLVAGASIYAAVRTWLAQTRYGS